jgi:hypothetical protein
MANMRGVTTALILLSGSTAMALPSGDPLPADAINFEISSWGYPIEGFRISSDGRGEYRRAPEFRAALKVHHFNAGPAGFARIRAALAGIEHFTVQAPACGARATDLPSGMIVWQVGTGGTALGIDAGCQDPEMQSVLAAANDAARIAEQFARPGGAR